MSTLGSGIMYISGCSVHRGKNKFMTEFTECFGTEILCFVLH